MDAASARVWFRSLRAVNGDGASDWRRCATGRGGSGSDEATHARSSAPLSTEPHRATYSPGRLSPRDSALGQAERELAGEMTEADDGHPRQPGVLQPVRGAPTEP